jgi:hypothetical protein
VDDDNVVVAAAGEDDEVCVGVVAGLLPDGSGRLQLGAQRHSPFWSRFYKTVLAEFLTEFLAEFLADFLADFLARIFSAEFQFCKYIGTFYNWLKMVHCH